MSGGASLTKSGHIAGLDGLRALAILGVVGYHLLPGVLRGGYLGVLLFWVISGYLLSVTSERSASKGRFRTGEFYKKRVLRLYPALLLMLVFVTCFFTLFLQDELRGIRRELLSVVFGYNNWWQIAQQSSYFARLSSASAFTHLWFLAVQIQVCLLWPLFFKLYKALDTRWPRLQARNLFLVLAVASAAAMAALYRPGQDVSRLYYGTDTRAFAFFVGAYAGTLKRKAAPALSSGEKKIGIAAFALGTAATLAGYFLFDGQQGFMYQGGMALFTLLFAGMVMLAASLRLPIGRAIDRQPLLWMGQRSYEIYLWHYPILFCCARLSGADDLSLPLLLLVLLLTFLFVQGSRLLLDGLRAVKAPKEKPGEKPAELRRAQTRPNNV